jgi:peptide/nickel transport system ATP-binding protein
MLELDGVTKTYRTGTFGGTRLPAIRQANFVIRPGEITSLIGESGSGKSTLGKMILRLTPVTSGSILFNGEDIAAFQGRQLREYYRHVQGVFQDPYSSYNPIFRADRVYAMIRDAYFPDASDREWGYKVESAVASVGLNAEDVLGKFTHQLSGGQLQRLLIARALLLDIKMLVADEIISMLDASTRVDVLNLLVELKARGLGVLFITHDLSLGNYISERTIILRRGVILEMGSTSKVFDNPQHEYTKMLLASVPQLHKKWDARLDGPGQGGRGAPHSESIDTKEDIANSRERYSKSALHPLARRGRIAQGRVRRAQEQREIDGLDGSIKTDAYLRSNEELPQLIEIEDDHYVARPVDVR